MVKKMKWVNGRQAEHYGVKVGDLLEIVREDGREIYFLDHLGRERYGYVTDFEPVVNGLEVEEVSIDELPFPLVAREGLEMLLAERKAEKWEALQGGGREFPHNHYFIDVGEHLDQETGRCLVDVYVILEKFKVTDPCLQHVAKKALATGNRGHKDIDTDIQDMIDTLERLKEIRSKTK